MAKGTKTARLVECKVWRRAALTAGVMPDATPPLIPRIC
ncbi:hypothetical protein UMN179_01062 [Gallibacterium anatis UMN179]|uniref:Uncharacterized protein n=1 Tax=Gallibacterium anatis (strain UMN179) TaxID=1005058 RepID=F4H8T4_GALAU|nr:hypothetical protein UMN179_01062 [Gallibacterium anatis UMN179]